MKLKEQYHEFCIVENAKAASYSPKYPIGVHSRYGAWPILQSIAGVARHKILPSGVSLKKGKY